ncbi:MAG: restriction endonuclease subunit S [Desulfobacterales bacterium]|nr:restriction endonuclease subunit S [Desulfobacterales bacterium]
MKNWANKKLQDLCTSVISGGTPLRTVADYYKNGKIPWLKTSEVKKTLIYETEEKITEKGLQESSAKLIPENSIIVAMYGDGNTAGHVAINKIPLSTNQACCNFIIDSNEAYYKFIYYYLKGNYNNLINLKLGGSQQNLNATNLKKFPIKIPKPETQKKIAAVLSAYDDLIENNKRRIAILENMAEEIYREWFVRFRFPGHEKVKFEKGVPANWNVIELKNIAYEASKSTKPGEHLSNRFYLPLDLLNTKRILPAGHLDYTEAKSSLATFEEGDILFGAMRPYLHKVAIAPFKGITRTTCFVIRPYDEEDYAYVFLTLFQAFSVDYATMICNGSDRPYVVWNKAMERMQVLYPEKAVLKSFEKIVRPILNAIKKKYFILKHLEKTRALLLPRLISGKHSVEDLDIQFPPSMLDEPPEIREAAYA